MAVNFYNAINKVVSYIGQYGVFFDILPTLKSGDSHLGSTSPGLAIDAPIGECFLQHYDHGRETTSNVSTAILLYPNL